MGRRDRNREQIRKWIEIVLPRMERPTQGNINLEEIKASGERPSSKPPLPDHALELVDHVDNRHTAACLNPALQWLAENAGHLHFVTRLVMQEPALPRKWSENSAQAGLYRKAIARLEEYVEWRFPGERLRVAVDPKDEPVESRREAYLKDVKADARDAYRILSEAVDTKMAAERSKSAAVQEVAQEWDTSPARVWRALAEMRESG